MQLSSAAFRLLRSSGFQSSPVPEDGCNCFIYANIISECEFQSSPVPEDGCNGRFVSMMKLILVSILTRPGGRVQLNLFHRCFLLQNWFQSSPVPEDGCNEQLSAGVVEPDGHVSILTRPGGRVQQHARVHLGGSGHSFNPHPSRRTGATSLRRNMPRTALPVSILTRPGGRVQLQHVGFTSAGYKEVSILTRPGGRVQPRPRFGSGTLLWFQSSPVPEDGCNHHL